MDGLGRARRAKVAVSEVARSTQIHRKIVSRLYNHPQTPVKGETIDKLAQFFLAEFSLISPEDKNLRSIMEDFVLRHLVVVFPDDEVLYSGLISKASLRSREGKYLALTHIWDNFQKLDATERETRRESWLLSHREKKEKLKPKPRKKRKITGLRKQIG